MKWLKIAILSLVAKVTLIISLFKIDVSQLPAFYLNKLALKDRIFCEITEINRNLSIFSTNISKSINNEVGKEVEYRGNLGNA